MTLLTSQLEATVAHLRERLSEPVVGIILGSGLGDLVDEIKKPVVIPYQAIPNFPRSTVEGHPGRLVYGDLGGKKILAMQGRFHYYEGYDLAEVTFPVRVMRQLGIKQLLVTNAAGGINLAYNPGDLMLITDHINFLGVNPLRGPNSAVLGPRFPDLSEAYCKDLCQLAKNGASDLGLTLHEGIYAWVSGPSYETPAEVNCLRLLGADAVGMSTVPEVIVANHCGLKVVGLSLITNVAAGIGEGRLAHEEVVATAERGKQQFQSLVTRIVAAL